ncbi:MAG: tRNA glutamyl-Q(34) synthetase GluQRS, partial [Gammaproteobacteria bacterium]|nr:tRNA glutamyl-Q(34) synthetase GluQRS [Gammaproteobacteria bacterium]
KLSKQTGAPEVDNNSPNINLLRALSFLLQEPPEALLTAPVARIWEWTTEHWDITRLEGVQSRSERSIMVQ